MNNADFLAAIAGVILTLIFSYVPGISDAYEKLTETAKRLVMLGLLVITTACAVGLACAGFGPEFKIPFTCDRAGFVMAVQAFMYAVIANQTFHRITKPAA